MQNFEIVLVDSKEQLEAIGKIPAEMSESFLRETYALLSFSDQDLREKKTGMLASEFPSAWTDPEAWNPYSDARSQLTFLAKSVGKTPLLLVVLYDGTRRAPDSDGDRVGLISLGCVLENMWLASESLGLAFNVHTVVGDGPVETHLRSVLAIPARMKVAFACGIGYSAGPSLPFTRVRREVDDFVHRNVFGEKSDQQGFSAEEIDRHLTNIQGRSGTNGGSAS
jgi:nitroreductase